MSAIDPNREAIAEVAIIAAWADGDIRDEEKQALDRIFQRLGFSRAEIMARIGSALRGPRTEPIDLPTDPEFAIELMRYALAVTLADGDLTHAEVNFLAQLAAHLEVSSTRLEALKNEAETLVGGATAPKLTTCIARIEALLPEAKVKLADIDLQHAPAPKQSVSEDAASRTALSRVLYQGEDFGAPLDL